MQNFVKQLVENIYCLHKNNPSIFLWIFKQEEFSLILKKWKQSWANKQAGLEVFYLSGMVSKPDIFLK